MRGRNGGSSSLIDCLIVSVVLGAVLGILGGVLSGVLKALGGLLTLIGNDMGGGVSDLGVVLGVVGIVGVVLAILGILVGVLHKVSGDRVGVISDVIAIARARRTGQEAPTHQPTVPALVPRSLCWVRGLLPAGEGADWWAEVTSCLAETRDRGQQLRYARSYRRAALQLLWTSWALHLRSSRYRELS